MADEGAKVEEVRREVAGLKAQVSFYCPNVSQDLTNLKEELAKPKEEMRATRPKAEPVALRAVNAAVSPAPHRQLPPR
jgi:hypothetical protein